MPAKSQPRSLPTALIVAPHPDDAEIGMGGTIAALSRSKYRVVIVDLTDGEPTPYGSPQIRARETKKATKILGVSERVLIGLKNRELFDTVDAREALAGLFRYYKPATIFAPYWIDAHPDHVEASKLVDSARFYSKFVKSDLPHDPWYPARIIYYFSTHLRIDVTPSFVYDVSATFEKKMGSIEAYSSQFVHHPANRKRLAEIKNEGAYWGSRIYREYGEPFVMKEAVRVDEGGVLLGL